MSISNNLVLKLPHVQITADPQQMEDAYAMTINLQIHRGLFRYNPQGQVLPDLADTWTMSKDGTTYVFTLRRATFSDGSPILASHVVNSLARIFAHGASIGADLDYIQGVAKFRKSLDPAALGIRKIADDQIEITLDHPSGLLTKQLAAVDCAILKLDDFRDKAPISPLAPTSGPYKVASWGHDRVSVVKWRADSLDSSKPPAQIDFLITAQSGAVMAERGEIDALEWDVISEEMRRALVKSGWIETVTDLVVERFVVMNPAKIALDVRKYLYHAFDSEVLARKIAKPGIFPAYGYIPHGVPGHLSKEDTDQLRQEKVLAPKGGIELEYAYSPEQPTFPFAEHLKSVWETKNFKVSLKPLTRGEQLRRMFAKEGGVMLGAKGLDYFDGFSVVTYFRSTYQSNYLFFDDREIDRQLDEAASTLDPDKRHAIYRGIQRAALRQYTVIPIIFGGAAAGLWSPNVAAVPAHPGGLHTLPLETVEMRK